MKNTRLILGFAWLVSIVATCGSLYFSLVRKFIPCDFCWYQRICMYPLVILLGIATFKNDVKMKIYILPLTLIGITLSTTQYLEQKLHIFGELCGRTSVIPCSTIYVNYFGFITIPFMALVAFLLIIFALGVLLTKAESK